MNVNPAYNIVNTGAAHTVLGKYWSQELNKDQLYGMLPLLISPW